VFFHLLPGRMDGAVEGAVADVIVALLIISSSKTASWRLLILSPLALPRLALPRADRGVSLHQQSVWPTLAFWFKPSPEGLCLGSRECGRLRRPFNDFRRLTGSRREHGLDGLDGLLDLLVADALTPPLCSSFISRGTRSARILRYAAG
jgi:hypothetical protein